MKIKSYLDLVRAKGQREFIKLNQDSDPKLAKDRNGNGPDVFGGEKVKAYYDHNKLDGRLGNAPGDDVTHYENCDAEDIAYFVEAEQQSGVEKASSKGPRKTMTPQQVQKYRVAVNNMMNNKTELQRIYGATWRQHVYTTARTQAMAEDYSRPTPHKCLTVACGHQFNVSKEPGDTSYESCPKCKGVASSAYSGLNDKGGKVHASKMRGIMKHNFKEDDDLLDDWRLAVINDTVLETFDGELLISDVIEPALTIYDDLDWEAQDFFLELLSENTIAALEFLESLNEASLGEGSAGHGGFLVAGGHLPTMEHGKRSKRLMGAAWAALTSDYRGHSYEGPDKDEALAKLKRMYHPGEK